MARQPGERDRWGLPEELAFIARLRTLEAVVGYRLGLAQRVRDFDGGPMTETLRAALAAAALLRGTQLIATPAPDFVE